jgi:hypothetical protein
MGGRHDAQPVHRQRGCGKAPVLKTADYFAKRSARADFPGFDRLMKRRGGEPPRPEDELPENYRKKRSTSRRGAK